MVSIQGEKIGGRRTRLTLLRDAGEEDGAGLRQPRVRVRDQVALAEDQPVPHLDPEVVEDPDWPIRS